MEVRRWWWSEHTVLKLVWPVLVHEGHLLVHTLEWVHSVALLLLLVRSHHWRLKLLLLLILLLIRVLADHQWGGHVFESCFDAVNQASGNT